MRINERIKNRYFRELEQNCLLGLAKVTTFAQRKKAVNYFIKFMNKNNISIKNLDPLHVHEFLQYLSSKENHKGKKLAPATLKQIYALVKSFYVRCYERKFTSKHPDLIFTKNLLRQYKLGEHKLPKYIDQKNMSKLLIECPDRWKALLHFMYDTGARISEVLNVQKQHLDLTQGLVQIYEPKTMNIRVTTLSETTLQLLKEYFLIYRPEPRPQYESFVFINQQRRRMSPRAVQYIVKKLSTTILGEKNAITPHYFRAACAVHLLESGVDIRQVQEIIGWKSLSVVQNYTRVTPQRQAEIKKQHHPGFRTNARNRPESKEQLISPLIQPDAFQTQMIEEQRKYRKELDELNRKVQREQLSREQERQVYEQRINELHKTHQELNALLKSQQQLIQLLVQKST